MKIVQVHYHLHRGGVTSIIKSIASFLDQAPINYIILAGEASEDLKKNYPIEVIEELGYSDISEENEILPAVAKIRALVKNCLGQKDIIWHFHNHALGKNLILPALVNQLAQDKEKLLLEFHDFAEDGRATNYNLIQSCKRLYPQAEHIFYAAINSRDMGYLKLAGCKEERLVYLPNPIDQIELKLPNRLQLTEEKNCILYPVRGIRRKNLGELVLWSLLGEESSVFVVTLGVENSKWKKIYQQWKVVARELEAPVIFEGGGHEFQDWLTKATHVISTSIAEGFGMLYVNSAAWNKPLWGRDLPQITKDFKCIEPTLFQHLYKHLWVPLDWLNQKEWEEAIEKNARNYYTSYNKPLSLDAMYALKQQLAPNGWVDFGNLFENFQIQILRKLKVNFQLSQEIKVELQGGRQVDALNWMKQAMKTGKTARVRSLLNHFSVAAFEGRLNKTYTKILHSNSSEVEEMDGQALLAQFLKLENFNCLRTDNE